MLGPRRIELYLRELYDVIKKEERHKKKVLERVEHAVEKVTERIVKLNDELAFWQKQHDAASADLEFCKSMYHLAYKAKFAVEHGETPYVNRSG